MPLVYLGPKDTGSHDLVWRLPRGGAVGPRGTGLPHHSAYSACVVVAHFVSSVAADAIVDRCNCLLT